VLGRSRLTGPCAEAKELASVDRTKAKQAYAALLILYVEAARTDADVKALGCVRTWCLPVSSFLGSPCSSPRSPSHCWVADRCWRTVRSAAPRQMPSSGRSQCVQQIQTHEHRRTLQHTPQTNARMQKYILTHTNRRRSARKRAWRCAGEWQTCPRVRVCVCLCVCVCVRVRVRACVCVSSRVCGSL
jgi:hypothetical protein